MYFEWLLGMQIFMAILMIVFLQKLTQMKKQIDNITKEVTQYISYVTEDLEEEETKTVPPIGQNQLNKKQEEAQNRLIQAVLGEYFP